MTGGEKCWVFRHGRTVATKDDKEGDASADSLTPSFTPEGLVNSDSGKSEALASGLQVKWQSVNTVWSGSDWDDHRSDANLTVWYLSYLS
jgi:hypothetical protein